MGEQERMNDAENLAKLLGHLKPERLPSPITGKNRTSVFGDDTPVEYIKSVDIHILREKMRCHGLTRYIVSAIILTI